MADYPIDASNASEPQNTRKVAYAAEEMRAMKVKLNNVGSGIFTTLQVGATNTAAIADISSGVGEEALRLTGSDSTILRLNTVSGDALDTNIIQLLKNSAGIFGIVAGGMGNAVDFQINTGGSLRLQVNSKITAVFGDPQTSGGTNLSLLHKGTSGDSPFLSFSYRDTGNTLDVFAGNLYYKRASDSLAISSPQGAEFLWNSTQFILPADASNSSGAVRLSQVQALLAANSPANIAARTIFTASRTGATQVITSVSTAVTGTWTGVSQTGTSFDSTSGQFTVPTTGWYEFSAQATITKTVAADADTINITSTAGLAIFASANPNVAVGTWNVSLSSGPVRCTAGDIIRIEVIKAGSASVDTVTAAKFSGRFIQT